MAEIVNGISAAALLWGYRIERTPSTAVPMGMCLRCAWPDLAETERTVVDVADPVRLRVQVFEFAHLIWRNHAVLQQGMVKALAAGVVAAQQSLYAELGVIPFRRFGVGQQRQIEALFEPD